MILQTYFVIYVGGICGLCLDYGRCYEYLPPKLIYSMNSTAYWKVKHIHLLPYLCEHLYIPSSSFQQIKDPLPSLVSRASRYTSGLGEKERLVTFARYSWTLPECWQSQSDCTASNYDITSMVCPINRTRDVEDMKIFTSQQIKEKGSEYIVCMF